MYQMLSQVGAREAVTRRQELLAELDERRRATRNRSARCESGPALAARLRALLAALLPQRGLSQRGAS
jgi:hypothetical protein